MKDIPGRKKIQFISRVFLLSALMSSLLPVVAAVAVTDKADLVVATKMLPLLALKTNDPTTTVAVIFDPASPASKQDAEGVKSILGGNFETPGNIKLRTVLVPVNKLEMLASSKSKMAILTEGLSDHYDDISKVSASNNILTVSTDLGCVRANKCILGIVTKPTVDIYYSKSAAEAANIAFSQVFTLLVKQI